jgi:drug/metabolite transporter (DMT)-like permease
VPFGFWPALAALVLLCTITAGFGWFWTFKHVKAGPAAISIFTIPIFGLVWSRMWLGEPISPATAIAAVAIILGVILAEAMGLLKEKSP